METVAERYEDVFENESYSLRVLYKVWTPHQEWYAKSFFNVLIGFHFKM